MCITFTVSIFVKNKFSHALVSLKTQKSGNGWKKTKMYSKQNAILEKDFYFHNFHNLASNVFSCFV